MATPTSTHPATLTVPAAYLDDMQSAMIAELVSDSDQLRVAHAELLERPDLGPEDRDSAVDILRRDLRVLHALVTAAAADGVELTSERDHRSCPLTDALQMLVRQLAERLADIAQFGPVPMREVLDVAERLRWAAEEAVRIEPALDTRLTLAERGR